MQTVYNAQNDIDAQLVVDRLAAEGIAAQVVGSFLSGAAGELPAQSMVGVQVAGPDVGRARQLVVDWQREMRSEPDVSVEEPEDATPQARVPQHSLRGSGLGSLLIGLLVGALGAYAFLRLPPITDEIDYDGDRVIDVRYRYNGDVLGSIEYDRNGDGVVDFRFLPSHKTEGDGIQLADDNFDGRFERRDEVERDWVKISKYDRDGDGFHESREVYRHGVLEEVIYLDSRDRNVIKRVHFEHGELKRSEADFDRDGNYEVQRDYDALGEPQQPRPARPSADAPTDSAPP